MTTKKWNFFSKIIVGKLLKGSVLVDCLKPKKSTFNQYAYQTFITFIVREFETVSRLDVGLTHIKKSLKETTQLKSGKGIQRKVEGNTQASFN